MLRAYGISKTSIICLKKDETLWLTQKSIAELFEKGRSTITEHLKKIFTDKELDEKVVCRYFRHTTQHGAIADKTQTKEIKYYNLRAITAVGYRVNSHRATQFRKHAPDGKILKSDVTIAKNYLDKEHIKALERVVTANISANRKKQKDQCFGNARDAGKSL